jgi:ADP-ribose pyrophosphatase
MQSTPRHEREAASGQIRAWETLSSSAALAEKWFTVRRDTVRLPSGTVLDDFFVWESPHIVTVVPYTTDAKFVLIRQYRHAIGMIDYQFPAGGADPGEAPELAALRELEEETGYIGGEIIHLYQASPNGHKITDLEDLYVVMGAYAGGTKREDENEPIEIVLKTPMELAEMIGANELHGATATLAGLLALRHLLAVGA